MYFHHIHPSSNSPRLCPQLPVHPTLRSPPHCVAQLLLGVVPALDRNQPTRSQVIKQVASPPPAAVKSQWLLSYGLSFSPPCWDFVWLKLVQVF